MTAESDSNLRTKLLGGLLGVQRHEFTAVAWSFAYFFCVLSSYYIIRPIREAMAVQSGSGTIPYLFIGTFVVTMVVTSIFGWIASKFPRKIFLPWVYLFFVSNILIFWALFARYIDDGQDHIWLGRVFFVWLSVFNLFVVSVFWSFMADIYTREQGRRLFGVITSGGSIGALLGGIVTSYYVTDIGFQNLFPISAALLSVAVICIAKLRRWVANERRNEITNTVESGKPLGGSPFAGITHVFRSRYFLGISAASVIASLLGTALYMFAAQLVEAEGISVNESTRFYSNLNVAQNFFTPILQMFVVGRVVVRYGVNVSLVLMPILSIFGFIVVAMNPTLLFVSVLTVVRRVVGFGFSKPTSDMLYSVVTPEEKYKAKNFIDLPVYRAGDVVGTWTIKLLSGLGMAGISLIMVPFSIIWAILALWLGNDYRRQAKALKQDGVA